MHISLYSPQLINLSYENRSGTESVVSPLSEPFKSERLRREMTDWNHRPQLDRLTKSASVN